MLAAVKYTETILEQFPNAKVQINHEESEIVFDAPYEDRPFLTRSLF